MKKRFLNLVLLTIFIYCSCSDINNPAQNVVALLNGEQITADEVQARLAENRASIIRYYRMHYNAVFDESFWNKVVSGRTPADMARQMTLQQVLRHKLRLMLARETGLINDISYAGFVRQLAEENERRKSAMADKKVIYGPVEYSEPIYYHYVQTSVNIDLQEKLDQLKLAARKRILVSCLKHKQESNHSTKGFFGKAVLAYVSPLTNKSTGVLIGASNLRTNVLSLVSNMLEKNTSQQEIDELLVRLHWQIEWKTVTFDDSDALWPEFQNISAEIKDLIAEIPKGKSALLEKSGDPVIVHIEKKKSIHFKDLDELVNSLPEKFTEDDISWLLSSILMQSNLTVYPDKLKQIRVE